jgi:hypothetical protein
MATERLYIRVMVTCIDSNGAPDFYPCIVKCNDQQYDNGEHRDRAILEAESHGYEKPMIAFDEMDPAGIILTNRINWGHVHKVTI